MYFLNLTTRIITKLFLVKAQIYLEIMLTKTCTDLKTTSTSGGNGEEKLVCRLEAAQERVMDELTLGTQVQSLSKDLQKSSY